MTDRICVKCKVYYKEERWIVIDDLYLNVCSECMQEIKNKIIVDLQNEKRK